MCSLPTPAPVLTKIKSHDAQWLQTQADLANGGGFNMTTRDVGRNPQCGCSEYRIDPNFAAGKNGTAVMGNDQQVGFQAQDQLNIGANLRFLE